MIAFEFETPRERERTDESARLRKALLQVMVDAPFVLTEVSSPCSWTESRPVAAEEAVRWGESP